ncbi:unnamed protein product [Brassica oleracea var. botrytis]
MRNRKGRGNCKNNSALLMLFVRKLCASTDLQKQQREKIVKIVTFKLTLLRLCNLIDVVGMNLTHCSGLLLRYIYKEDL